MHKWTISLVGGSGGVADRRILVSNPIHGLYKVKALATEKDQTIEVVVVLQFIVVAFVMQSCLFDKTDNLDLFINLTTLGS